LCRGLWLAAVAADHGWPGWVRITETLEVIPKSWKVIQHVREKFSCRDCEKIYRSFWP
jgi:hypothetical protein